MKTATTRRIKNFFKAVFNSLLDLLYPPKQYRK